MGERGTSGVLWAEISAAADAPMGAFDLTVSGAGGASAAGKIFVDDLMQVEKVEKGMTAVAPVIAGDVWGDFAGARGCGYVCV